MTDSAHSLRPVSSLLTDLYQLTMLQAYWLSGMNETAVFEFFVRKMPQTRNFLMAAGLEQVLCYLETLRFSTDEIGWLRSLDRFDPAFLDWLAELRFRGDVHAMPEGTVFFQDEPILRVAAPMPEAQLVESRIVNLLHFQTLIASKAARMVLQQPSATLIDFGLRRAHGAEAGLLAARASYIAGFTGSATLEAERAFGVPAFGTMAHSFVQAHASEHDAFRSFAAAWSSNVILLIDTYDTIAAAHDIVRLAAELAGKGITVQGVRLDSGDLIALAEQVRGIFDAAGLHHLRIFASSSVDEHLMAKAVAAGAPIDGYGIGTHLTTSADVPYLDCAYKLQEYAGQPRRKRSTGKATWPGRKQVHRLLDPSGRIVSDIVTREGDPQPGEPLLVQVMRNGRRLGPAEPIAALRARAAAGLRSLLEPLRALDRTAPEPLFQPVIAQSLHDLADRADALVAASHDLDQGDRRPMGERSRAAGNGMESKPMTTIRNRLREAIERQSVARSAPLRGAQDAAVEIAFAPVREAARQIQDELKNVPEIGISLEPDAVLITLNEKDLWFSYDPKQHAFVASESDTLWMEGGQREETYEWPTAEACIEAMIQAAARCVALARAAATLRRGSD